MKERVRLHDWGATALGPIATWPQPLRTMVDLILSSNLPMVMVWGPDAQLIYNDAYAEFAGGRHPYLLGLNVLAAWPEVAEFNQHVLAATLAGQALSYKDQPLVLFRNGHAEDVWLDLDYTPLRDAAGVPRGFLATVVETTARVKAERAYHRAREQVELALDAGAVLGTWMWDVPNDRVVVDHRLARIFAVDPVEAAAGLPIERFFERIHPHDLPEVEVRVHETVSRGLPYRCQYRIQRSGDEYLWVEGSGRCQRGADGRPTYFAGLIVDVHERKLAEQQQRIMINELNHRVKNTLAIVQSLAAQSFSNADSVEAAAEVFNARLISLSHAHDVLTREHWHSALLGDLVEQMAQSHNFRGSERFEIEGPPVRLSPQNALSFALALHELATNAIKYGALGECGGGVRIHWRVGETNGRRILHLDWIEHDGPPVQPPTHKGFGTRLIERSLNPSRNGAVSIDYRESGLTCHLAVPLPEVEED
ncbi:MAG TPA: HWE histidine kinase domain-containing protein [Frateuria sp.]|uniref:sensor histidine kinase n=1 Tax=Frateuria sp. TaxID=2211372 RepID=UPI002D80130B|nr:HWE histidine kinase domain-containing protein [Frateuria sp.]HET6805448.1 HWE histidine kinase domain-containing protein [Frateuria sp.]